MNILLTVRNLHLLGSKRTLRGVRGLRVLWGTQACESQINGGRGRVGQGKPQRSPALGHTNKPSDPITLSHCLRAAWGRELCPCQWLLAVSSLPPSLQKPEVFLEGRSKRHTSLAARGLEVVLKYWGKAECWTNQNSCHLHGVGGRQSEDSNWKTI